MAEVEESLKPQKKVSPWLIVLIVVLVLAVIGVAAYFVIRLRSAGKSSSTPTKTSSLSDRIVDEGVTWITPQKLEDLGLFEKISDQSAFTNADYFKVGTTASGGEIIVAEINIDGPVLTKPVHLLVKKGEEYRFLTMNGDSIESDFGYTTSTKVVEQTNSIVFKSLLSDKVISKGTTELVESDNMGIVSMRSDDAKPKGESKKVESTKWGDLYFYEEKPEAEIKEFTLGYYYILLNDSSWQVYESKPVAQRDDNTLDVTWKVQGLDNVKYIKAATGGCGMGAGAVPVMTNKTDLNDAHLIATDKNGGKYYGPKSTGDTIAKLGYDEYKVGRDENNLVSIDKFISDEGMIVWVDGYGTSITFQREEYQPQAECGKPVVYLYPTQTTDFSVKVGAKITKSEPEYGNGWKVTAEPSGRLTLGDGRVFESLFWDGLGFGKYPSIVTGKIIKTADARTVITADMKYMGFNQKETGDFLEFWLPKMPTTPFTRITWLQNKEMDALAPLSINPKPDTTIRAFLDYRGLNETTYIAPQTLIKTERSGYVATEWGGLLVK